jgi:hypothetical protein
LTRREITDIVARQPESLGSFTNYHGTTPENVHSFLVETYEAVVDPDDAKTSPKLVRVVLRTHKRPTSGYVVVDDPDEESRGVAEATSSSTNLLVISEPTLADALSGM